MRKIVKKKLNINVISDSNNKNVNDTEENYYSPQKTEDNINCKHKDPNKDSVLLKNLSNKAPKKNKIPKLNFNTKTTKQNYPTERPTHKTIDNTCSLCNKKCKKLLMCPKCHKNFCEQCIKNKKKNNKFCTSCKYYLKEITKPIEPKHLTTNNNPYSINNALNKASNQKNNRNLKNKNIKEANDLKFDPINKSLEFDNPQNKRNQNYAKNNVELENTPNFNQNRSDKKNKKTKNLMRHSDKNNINEPEEDNKNKRKTYDNKKPEYEKKSKNFYELYLEKTKPYESNTNKMDKKRIKKKESIDADELDNDEYNKPNESDKEVNSALKSTNKKAVPENKKKKKTNINVDDEKSDYENEKENEKDFEKYNEKENERENDERENERDNEKDNYEENEKENDDRENEEEKEEPNEYEKEKEYENQEEKNFDNDNYPENEENDEKENYLDNEENNKKYNDLENEENNEKEKNLEHEENKDLENEENNEKQDENDDNMKEEENQKLDFCPEHNTKKLIYYCFQCDKDYCQDCLINHPNEHNLIEYTKIDYDKFKDLLSQKKEVIDRNKELQNYLNDLEQKLKSYKLEKDLFITEINKIANNYIGNIDSKINSISSITDKIKGEQNKIVENFNGINDKFNLFYKKYAENSNNFEDINTNKDNAEDEKIDYSPDVRKWNEQTNYFKFNYFTSQLIHDIQINTNSDIIIFSELFFKKDKLDNFINDLQNSDKNKDNNNEENETNDQELKNNLFNEDRNIDSFSIKNYDKQALIQVNLDLNKNRENVNDGNFDYNNVTCHLLIGSNEMNNYCHLGKKMMMEGNLCIYELVPWEQFNIFHYNNLCFKVLLFNHNK